MHDFDSERRAAAEKSLSKELYRMYSPSDTFSSGFIALRRLFGAELKVHFNDPKFIA